jgi:hypothetical protein
MPRYSVRLRIRCKQPPTPELLAELRGGRWGITATRRREMVSVRMSMEAGDPAGALARCMNVLLDRLGGEVVSAATDRVPRAVTGRS